MGFLEWLESKVTEPVEIRPGQSVALAGKEIKLSVRVWRDAEKQWHDVEESTSSVHGEPR